DFACRAADNHLTTISHVFKETRSLWENYAPDYIEPGSIARPDSVVAGLGPTALLIETLLRLRVDAPARTLRWRPRLHESYGIERLRCGDSEITLMVTDGEQARITVSAPLSLRLLTAEGEQWVEVADEADIQW